MQWHMQIQIMRAANKMDILQKQLGLWKCMAFACTRCALSLDHANGWLPQLIACHVLDAFLIP
jgi:hypothetical protein